MMSFICSIDIYPQKNPTMIVSKMSCKLLKQKIFVKIRYKVSVSVTSNFHLQGT